MKALLCGHRTSQRSGCWDTPRTCSSTIRHPVIAVCGHLQRECLCGIGHRVLSLVTERITERTGHTVGRHDEIGSDQATKSISRPSGWLQSLPTATIQQVFPAYTARCVGWTRACKSSTGILHKKNRGKEQPIGGLTELKTFAVLKGYWLRSASV